MAPLKQQPSRRLKTGQSALSCSLVKKMPAASALPIVVNSTRLSPSSLDRSDQRSKIAFFIARWFERKVKLPEIAVIYFRLTWMCVERTPRIAAALDMALQDFEAVATGSPITATMGIVGSGSACNEAGGHRRARDGPC